MTVERIMRRCLTRITHRCGIQRAQELSAACADANPFEKFIRHYDQHHRGRVLEEENWFRSQPTLRDAIRSAAMARGPGDKKLDHQWRLKNSDLRRAEDALLAIERDIARCATFDHLHGLILRTARHIWKNPELYVYDTSPRIGAKLGLKPDMSSPKS